MSAASPRTALELYTYCKVHELGVGISQSWSLKHFGLIENVLGPDEQVLTAFVGFYDSQPATQHNGNFAYAITNKRFIIAQKKMIGSVLQTVSLSNVNDITMNKKLIYHTIVVDTIKETFGVSVSEAKVAQNIYDAIHAALEKAKGGSSLRSGASDMTTQLVELKKLFDAGIITARDFEAKKKQLLGI